MKSSTYREFTVKAAIAGIIAVIALHIQEISGSFLAQVTGVLGSLVLAFFVGLLCIPFLEGMKRWRIPEWLGIIIIYLVVFMFIFLLFFAVLPIVIEQIDGLISSLSSQLGTFDADSADQSTELGTLLPFLPDFIGQYEVGNLMPFLQENFSSLGAQITSYIGNALEGFNKFFFSFTGAVVQLVLVLTFAFFFLLERKSIYKTFHGLLPAKASKYLKKKDTKVTDLLHAWLKGQILLGLSIFALTYIGLWILVPFGIDVEKQFALAFIAGLTEFIPYLGPIIALIPALVVGFGLGWGATLGILIVYLVIQRLENNLLVPVVMSKSVNISAFTVLVVMAIGASLFGVLGILLAVPFTALANIFIHDWAEIRRK